MLEYPKPKIYKTAVCASKMSTYDEAHHALTDENASKSFLLTWFDCVRSGGDLA